MDYKKKYEESLERGSRLWESGSITLEDYEYMFPEHKESEDEKIRKEIISFLKEGIPYYCSNTVRRQEWATWLEKQGKNEEINEASYRAGIKRVLDNPESYGLEKQGEQKPVPDDELSDFESALFSAFSDAWQEYLSGKEVNVAKWTKEHSAELLEVAREQKPAWSEEDEKIMNQIVFNLEKCIVPGFSVYVGGVELGINWLKSLKERYTWKPSEGQLECLGYAIEKAEKDWSPLTNNRIYLTLKALKEQLEKL